MRISDWSSDVCSSDLATAIIISATSTCAMPRRAIRPLLASGTVIAAADITASMGRDAPFSVERRWFDDKGLLGLSFRIANRSDRPLEIGALGMPMVFDNMLIDRSLEQAHTQASFVEIGRAHV